MTTIYVALPATADFMAKLGRALLDEWPHATATREGNTLVIRLSDEETTPQVNLFGGVTHMPVPDTDEQDDDDDCGCDVPNQRWWCVWNGPCCDDCSHTPTTHEAAPVAETRTT